jgi:hypothetical protein
MLIYLPPQPFTTEGEGKRGGRGEAISPIIEKDIREVILPF